MSCLLRKGDLLMDALKIYKPEPFVQELRSSAKTFLSSGNKFFRALGKYSGTFAPEVVDALKHAKKDDGIKESVYERRRALAELALPYMNSFADAHKKLLQLTLDQAMSQQSPEKVAAYKRKQQKARDLKEEILNWQAKTKLKMALHPKYPDYAMSFNTINDAIEDALRKLTRLVRKSLPKASPLDLYKLLKAMKPSKSIMKRINSDQQANYHTATLKGRKSKGVVSVANKWFDNIQAKQKEFRDLFAAFTINLKEDLIPKQEFSDFFSQSKEYLLQLIAKHEAQSGKQAISFNKTEYKQRLNIDSLTIDQIKDLSNSLNNLAVSFTQLISLTEQAEVNDKETLALLNLIINEVDEIRHDLVPLRSYCEFRTTDKKGSEILDRLIGYFIVLLRSLKHNSRKYKPDSTVTKKTLSEALLSQLKSYQRMLPGIDAVLSSLEASITAHEDRQKSKAENSKQTPW